MKKLLLILSIFLVAQLHAGIRIAMVTKHPAVEAKPSIGTVASAAFITVSVYGLTPNGSAKDFEFKSTKDIKVFTTCENCPWKAEAGWNREAIRYILYFEDDGSPQLIDFHLNDPFVPVQVPASEMDAECVKSIEAIKTLIEAQ